MKRCTFLIAGLLVVAGGVSTASAVVVLDDNFDSYADTNAFKAVWTQVNNPAAVPPYTNDSGTIQTAVAQSAPNAVQITAPASPPTSANQRNERGFTATPVISTSVQVTFSFDFYDVDAAQAPFRQHANLQDTNAAGATNQLISMGMNNNQSASASGGQFYMARILGYTVPTGVGTDPNGGPDETAGGAGAYFKLNDYATGIGTGPGARSTGWHNLKVVISTNDGLSADYDFFVDGLLAEQVDNIGTAASLRKYDYVRIGSGTSSPFDAAYDNVKVEWSVPTPPGENGDYNNNGFVDAADYILYRKGVAPLPAHESDNIGTTDEGDYTVWRSNFGKPTFESGGGGDSQLGLGAVPEPTSVALVMLGLASLAMGCRRGR